MLNLLLNIFQNNLLKRSHSICFTSILLVSQFTLNTRADVCFDKPQSLDQLITVLPSDEVHPRIEGQAANQITVWDSNENIVNVQFPTGTGFDTDILLATSGDNGSNWSAATGLNTNAGADTGLDRSLDIKQGLFRCWYRQRYYI